MTTLITRRQLLLATAALKAGRSLAGIWMATVSFRKDKEGGAAIGVGGGVPPGCGGFHDFSLSSRAET